MEFAIVSPSASRPPGAGAFGTGAAVVWDTTSEKLGEILSRYDKGLLVKRDEIAGWVGAMEKYGGSSRGASADPTHREA